MKSNANKVSEFNRVMGLVPTDKGYGWPSEHQLNLRQNLIKEECTDELADAITDRNLVEVMDMVGDGLTVVYGVADDFGFSADLVMGIVCYSNMTKTCKSSDEAEETVHAYACGKHPDKLGERLETHWDIVDMPDNTYFVVYNSKTGKGLKSINYEPPTKYLKLYHDALVSSDVGLISALWATFVTHTSSVENLNNYLTKR